MTTVKFWVPGKPAAQGSKRHVGGGRMLESSAALGPWRERVALAAHAAMRGRPLIDGPVSLAVLFVLPRPKSAPKTRTPPATCAPDLDKLTRAIFDALQGSVLVNDALVVRCDAAKRRAELGEAFGAAIKVTAP